MTRSTVPVLGLVLALGFAGSADAQQMIGSCPVLPANNIWNTPIDTLPVLSNSNSMVNTIGANTGFHADFGAGTWNGGPIGIPFITVPGSQAKYPAAFFYSSESDPGPYAVPLNAPIEGGNSSTGDRHAIAIDTDNCLLYELYRAFPQSSSWTADSGAIFDLRSNALRPTTWTSADAAGLPIMPGLVTYEEVQGGEITHAIRFTAPRSRREYVWPARHYASSLTGTQYPRMGERFRLKSSFNITSYPPDVQVILRAMKKYGIILADNGSAWYISGKPDPRWNDNNLHVLGQLLGSNFEAIDATVLRIDPNSGAAIQSGVTVTVSPSSASVRVTRAQSFTATVTGSTSPLIWTVNDIAGGNAIVGTIAGTGSTTGQYIAPSAVPSPGVVTVRAASAAAPGAIGSASVTILPHPVIAAVSSSSVPIGNFTFMVNGTGFVTGSVISFDGAALATSLLSSTMLVGTGNAPVAKAGVPVFVNTPDGDASNVVFVDVTTANPVSIAISPLTATVRVNQTRQFTATVLNAANTAAIWTVNGMVGGNATIGTVSVSGLYQAPSSVPNPSTVVVTATALADWTKTARTSVTISVN